MNSSRNRKIAWAVLGIVALIVVAGIFFAIGANSSGGGFGYGHMRPYGPGFGMGGHGSFDGFGLIGLLWLVLIGVFVILLFAALLGPAGPRRPADAAPSDLDRLKELSEMHDRGALTDEEFAAAKRKLLGM